MRGKRPISPPSGVLLALLPFISAAVNIRTQAEGERRQRPGGKAAPSLARAPRRASLLAGLNSCRPQLRAVLRR